MEKEKKRIKRKVIKMRKLFILLAVLIAAPAFALTVTLVDNGGTVDVNYDATGDGDANQPRAFALTISVTGGATITGVTPAKTIEGESTAASPGFGIFPGTIDINDVNGHVNDYGTPVAPNSYPGAAGTGIDTNTVVLELGSLYEGARGDGNEPLESGTLATLTIDCNGATDVNVTAVEEDQYRGGIVLEDGSSATVPITPLTICAVAECFPSCHPDYAEWVAVGRPDSWCNVRQCYGDTDNVESNYGSAPPPIMPWPKAWVTVEDLSVLVAGYKQSYGGDPLVDPWIAADFNRQENNYGSAPPPIMPWPKARVTVEDLSILVAYYKASSVPVDCLDCP